MTRIKLIDLAVGFEPRCMPAIFSLKFKESNILKSAIYEAVELAYRTERIIEVEQYAADHEIKVVLYKVKFREVQEDTIVFTLEDAKYPFSPSN
jgi:hypothetical protein